MKQRINPVLPPPRERCANGSRSAHLLNPVDVLLTARSPQQVRMHFARYRRALLYEWERDPKYQGAKGSKWIGTGDDAGKTPRYQEGKPGAGRAGKKEGSPAVKKESKPTGGKAAGGGKQKGDHHSELVQHLHDILSGEGEQADELLAKLQDRLQGMSPEERQSARASLEGVLKGKKPAAKEKPKEKPAPAKRTPAAKKQGPKDGDTNAKGQVFKGGRWRKPEGAEKPKEKAPAKEKPQSLSPATSEALERARKIENKIAADDTSEFDGSVFAEIDDLAAELSRGTREDAVGVAKEMGLRLAPSASKAKAIREVVRLLTEQKGSADRIRPIRTPEREKPTPVPGSPVHEPPRLPEPPKIADKPTPGKPSGASPQELGKALKDSLEYLGMFVEHRDGLITMDRIYHELVKRVPDITPEQMQNTLWQLGKDYQLELHPLNEASKAPPSQKKYSIEHDGRMYNFVRLKNKQGDLVPSKPVGAEKQFRTRAEHEAGLNGNA